MQHRLGPSASAVAAAQAQPAALAPAPRIIKQLPDSFVRRVDGFDNNAAGASTSNGATLNTNGWDTWELSQLDSDYDDGYVPIEPPKIKYQEITGAEWEEGEHNLIPVRCIC